MFTHKNDPDGARYTSKERPWPHGDRGGEWVHSDTDLLDRSSSERLLSRAPIVIRRRVQWGECDPAGVVYTPRYADYAASAFQWFMRVVLRPALADDNIGTPLKALSFEFHRTLKPEELFDMCVLVSAIRSRTLDLNISATGADKTPRFECRVTPIMVNRQTVTSIDIPPVPKAEIFRYKDAYKKK